MTPYGTIRSGVLLTNVFSLPKESKCEWCIPSHDNIMWCVPRDGIKFNPNMNMLLQPS